VKESVRFFASELHGSRTAAQYRLRESGLTAHVRHPLLDMWVLEEIFRFRVYEPPPQAARSLAGVEGPLRILDLGGHIGLFALYACGRFPGASVVSFEPDPASRELLYRSIESNDLAQRWRVVGACAATGGGSVEFASSGQLSRADPGGDGALQDIQERIGGAFPFLRGTALLTPERVKVPRIDVFPFLAKADFVKMDIEGAEWEILADSRIAELGAASIVLEFHPTYGPGSQAEAVLREVLAGAGYEVGDVAGGGDTGMLWAWKPVS